MKFVDNLTMGLYGMTKEEAIALNICIDCKKKPVFYTLAGVNEYDISALCEPCFDKIFEGENDE